MAEGLKVILAGYNVDAEIIESLKRGEAVDVANVSPETIPASYARISRDPRKIPELRADARRDVARARKSNANIIFDMGHKSVGNHACFNFDILGVSRLAVEWLEARRAGAGYTEKSQRYVTLKGDYVVPRELSGPDQERFRRLVENTQNAFYKDAYETLVKHHFERNGTSYIAPGAGKRNATLEGLGKEDARYGLGLATATQVGTTFSASALENAVRIMKYEELAEVRDLARLLFEAVKDIAPSLILYTDPAIFQKSFPGRELRDDNLNLSPRRIRAAVSEAFAKHGEARPQRMKAAIERLDEVTLITCGDVDTNVISAALHSYSKRPAEDCYRLASWLTENEEPGRAFVKELLAHVTEYDNPPRFFEHGGGLMFEAVMSSSCFAQIKRHRMMTLLGQEYDPSLGVTAPDSVRQAGLEDRLKEVCETSAELYREFLSTYGRAAEYCLTNAHRRRVLMCMNPRELNHIARQRCDRHAQWEIRELSRKMVELTRRIAPLATLTTCGKDEFDALYQSVYGRSQPKAATTSGNP
ncbi:MAG: FAD-dependent thymidylate synthase [Vicinamibacteria bacterium]|nr:FAD-dependent thymidylate synthase [Vicinamibacteria bacterium]